MELLTSEDIHRLVDEARDVVALIEYLPRLAVMANSGEDAVRWARFRAQTAHEGWEWLVDGLHQGDPDAFESHIRHIVSYRRALRDAPIALGEAVEAISKALGELADDSARVVAPHETGSGFLELHAGEELHHILQELAPNYAA